MTDQVDAGVSGGDLDAPLSCYRSLAKAHLLTTCKQAAVLPAAFVRSTREVRRMRIQLHGLVAGMPIFF